MVERYVRDVEAAGSNPVASIEKRISDPGILFFLFFGTSVRDVGQKQPFGCFWAPLGYAMRTRRRAAQVQILSPRLGR